MENNKKIKIGQYEYAICKDKAHFTIMLEKTCLKKLKNKKM